jgi:multiple sugar transport system substrate-binding protein
VQFWQWGVVYNDGFDTLAKAFNGIASGVNVELTPAANGVNYWDKLTAALAGAVGPDVYLMNSNARTWAAKGLLRPLDDLITRGRFAVAANASIHPNFKEWYEVDGKQTGWGWDYSTIATVYNVAHLREAGLAPPADLGDAWNWNTFREYGQKLTRAAAGRWGAWANADYQTGWLNFVRANGGDYFTDDRKRCILGAPQAVEAIEFLTALVIRDQVSPTRADLAAVPGGAVRLFCEGRISIGTVGDWSFVEIMKGADQSLEYFHSIAGALVNDAWDAKLSAREAMTQAQERISTLL